MSAFILTVSTTCNRHSTRMSILIFTMPTTCSRPNTKMSGFIFFSCMHAYSVAGVLARPFNCKSWKFGDELGDCLRCAPRYRIFVRHTVSPLWHVGGFSETSVWIRSKFTKYLENNFVYGDTFRDIS